MNKAPKRKHGYTAKQVARIKALDPKVDKAPFTQELINEVVKRAAVDRQNALIAEIVKRVIDGIQLLSKNRNVFSC